MINTHWMLSVIVPIILAFGLGLVIFTYIASLNLTRIGRLAKYQRYRVKSKWQLFIDYWRSSEENTKSGRKLKERLKLAGDPWGLTVFRYQATKLSLILIWSLYWGGIGFMRMSLSRSLADAPIIPLTLGFVLIWFGPDLVLSLLAKRRKTNKSKA